MKDCLSFSFLFIPWNICFWYDVEKGQKLNNISIKRVYHSSQLCRSLHPLLTVCVCVCVLYFMRVNVLAAIFPHVSYRFFSLGTSSQLHMIQFIRFFQHIVSTANLLWTPFRANWCSIAVYSTYVMPPHCDWKKCILCVEIIACLCCPQLMKKLSEKCTFHKEKWLNSFTQQEIPQEFHIRRIFFPARSKLLFFFPWPKRSNHLLRSLWGSHKWAQNGLN